MLMTTTIATVPGAEEWPVVRKSRAIIMRSHADAGRGGWLSLSDYDLLLVKVGGCYLLPGGKIEAGEDSLEAVQREIGEEIGARAEPGTVIGVLEAMAKHQFAPAFTLQHLEMHYLDPHTEKYVDRVSLTDFWFMNLLEKDAAEYQPHPTSLETASGIHADYYSFEEIRELLHPESRFASPRRPHYNDELRAVMDNLSVMVDRALQRSRLASPQ